MGSFFVDFDGDLVVLRLHGLRRNSSSHSLENRLPLQATVHFRKQTIPIQFGMTGMTEGD